jgi:hypothetical protein
LPCSECCMLSSGQFPDVWILYANISEQTECSETLAYKIQTLGNYPEESVQYFYNIRRIEILIYLLTAVGLSPGGSTHLYTNNT